MGSIGIKQNKGLLLQERCVNGFTIFLGVKMVLFTYHLHTTYIKRAQSKHDDA